MRKLSEKHWLAVVLFAVLMAIMEKCPAFGATFVVEENGKREVACVHLSEEDYVKFVMAYNEGRLDFVNFRDTADTWWHFVNKENGSHIWLTKEEGINAAFYLEKMFNTGW